MLFTEGPTNTEHHIIIEKGQSLVTIGEQLSKKNIVNAPVSFVLGAILSQKRHRLIPGEYFFEKGMSAWHVVQKILRGNVIVHHITIVEGHNIAQICAQLQSNEKLSGIINHPPPEGMCLPQTYDYYLGDDRQKLLERFHKNMLSLLINVWKIRNEKLQLKSIHELLTLASIVEKETALPEEYNHVASVYLNRLKKGMLLQADPTVTYGLALMSNSSTALTFSDLKKNTPYNTYLYTGLPPGPICCPGEAALRAVAKAPQSDFYYFVANGKGGHIFSRTYQDHNRNVKKWYAIKREKNG